MTQRKRKIRVTAHRREQPDVRRLAHALIALAQAEAERSAQAQHEAQPHGADPASETPGAA